MKVPIVLLVGLGSAAFMIGLVATWSLTPTSFEPAPRPSPTERMVFIPLADCDRYGCVPAVVFVSSTPR